MNNEYNDELIPKPEENIQPAKEDDFLADVENEFRNKKMGPKHAKQLKKKTLLREILGWVQAIAIAIIVAMLINAFVFERAFVVGHSMNPTLQNGESLFEYKLGYLFGEPKRGDIVVFEYQKAKGKWDKWLPFYDPSEQDYIKRVIAVGGETIDIKENFVFINGQKLNEPYIQGITVQLTQESGVNFTYPYTVQKGEVFVLGDNRQESKDSRVIGPVKIDTIRGRAVGVIVPLDKIRLLPDNSWSFGQQ